MQYKVLVVEDDEDINKLLVRMLKEADYETIQAFSGTEAKLLFEKERPDLVLLDLMLSGMSGEEVLLDIREGKHSEVPVLVISAKNSVGDKVALLKNGADDYITKPFEPEEVMARILASLRRTGNVYDSDQMLIYKKLKLIPKSRKVMLDEIELVLTAHEYDILFLLMKNPKKVYSRESLYELVWHGGYYGENNTVNVHVSNLRKKIKEADCEAEYIQTVYGIGFKLQ